MSLVSKISRETYSEENLNMEMRLQQLKRMLHSKKHENLGSSIKMSQVSGPLREHRAILFLNLMLSLSIIFTYMKLKKEKSIEIITTNLLPWKKKVP